MPSVFKLERAAKGDKTLQMILRSNINLLSRREVIAEAFVSGSRRLSLLASTDAIAD